LDMPSGYLGGFPWVFIKFIIVFASFPYSIQGGLDVIISITQHPKLQISAGFPCPIFYIISGAIQYGDPITDFESFSSIIYP